MKVSPLGYFEIRNDNPQNVLVLMSEQDKNLSPLEFKQKANSYFTQAKYLTAIRYYKHGLAKMEENT